MEENPNMVAYAIAHRLTTEDIFAMDAEAYPGSPMAGYIGWITRMTGEWDKVKMTATAFTGFSDWLQYQARIMNKALSKGFSDPELSFHGYEEGQ